MEPATLACLFHLVDQTLSTSFLTLGRITNTPSTLLPDIPVPTDKHGERNLADHLHAERDSDCFPLRFHSFLKPFFLLSQGPVAPSPRTLYSRSTIPTAFALLFPSSFPSYHHLYLHSLPLSPLPTPARSQLTIDSKK
ncbi:hypothetical protein IE53DRAFT_78744 [Violaceomyces palustris]|uniref:Uncharacterized protein n=1 Tax=Violaceomyces palustris TaxID=1673888 RepID=A0ACD0NY47_9BASI|nr:hypothetical protein IE53DRAFT_78744 [Violaceomyces palustris]